MEIEIKNINTTIRNKEVKIVNLVKKDFLLFIELSNNRKFLTDGTLIQDFSEYEYFYNVFKMNNVTYVVMKKDWKKHLINFTTKEIIVSFNKYDNCFKLSENIFKIGNKLFNLKTKEYIPNTDSLKPLCHLGSDLYLFSIIDEDRLLILNENGEQLFDFGKTRLNNLVGKNLIYSDKENEEIKITKFKEGKFDKENEIIIKKGQTKPHYYKGNICIVKNNIVYVINPTLEILKQFPLPILGTITSSTIENNTLLMSIKANETQKVKAVGINLTNGKHFTSERTGIWPLEKKGPALNITIAMDNITYNEYGRETYRVRLLDENFNIIYEIENIVRCDYLVCNKWDKIWIKAKENGILYNASTKKIIETSYTDVHYQIFDENTKIEYGYGFNENTQKLQILDEEGNVLIEEVPYEQLGFTPHFRQFGFRYLNGYAYFKRTNTIDIGIKITRNSIIDSKGNILYSKANVSVSPIGNYFQIKEEDKTIYFNTLTREFTEKMLISSNNTPLLEEQNQFEITEDGALVLKKL